MRILKLNKASIINTVYVLFLLSGVLKAILTYLGIQQIFDITLFFSILIMLDIVYVILVKTKLNIKKNYYEYLLIVIAFQALVFISLIYTASPSFGYFKCFLLILNLIAFIYPIIRKDEIRIENVFNIIYKFIIPFSFFIIFLNLVRWTPYRSLINVERSDLVRGHYLTIGMFLGLITIFYIVLRKSKEVNLFWKIILPIFLLIISSARGPLIFFLLVFLIYLIFQAKKIKFKFNKKVLLIVFLFLLAVMLSPLGELIIGLLERTINRFYVLFFQDSGGNSVKERVEFFSFTLNAIFTQPLTFIFGNGIGSFMFLFNGEDIRGYPHNIILESWFEMGFVGAFLITLFLFFIFKFKANILSSKLILFYILLCYSKSGGLEDIRILYGVYSLYIGSLMPGKIFCPYQKTQLKDE